MSIFNPRNSRSAKGRPTFGFEDAQHVHENQCYDRATRRVTRENDMLYTSNLCERTRDLGFDFR